MVIPKYDINQIVFIYESGRLVEKVVNKIQILITENEFKVGYQFQEKAHFLLFAMRDIYKDESEVFKSLDDFIKLNTIEK